MVVEATRVAAGIAKAAETGTKVAEATARTTKPLAEGAARAAQQAGAKLEQTIKSGKPAGETLRAFAKEPPTVGPNATPLPERVIKQSRVKAERAQKAKPAETPVAEQPKAEASERADRVKQGVRESLDYWDKLNPQPAQGTPEFDDWAGKRAEMQKQVRVTAEVHEDMKEYDAKHPLPDKEKDPEAYDKAIAERGKYKAQQEEYHKEKANGEPSVSEIVEKTRRFKFLQERQLVLIEEIASLQKKASRTTEEEARLKKNRTDLKAVENEMKLIQKDLTEDLKRSPVVKKVLITTIAGTVLAAMFLNRSAEGV